MPTVRLIGYKPAEQGYGVWTFRIGAERFEYRGRYIDAKAAAMQRAKEMETDEQAEDQ